ncbi:ankyrin-2 [Asparagus officinalis]|nr:ankyrin-2 [Asparagus officinalis]
MGSDLVRPHVAVHALVCACSRGFVDVVDTLIKCGVDANVTDRMLLRSLKPSLHTNVDCTALVAAIVSRQVAIVRQLLQAGVRKDIKVNLGAWSWDIASGEEFRVGAGLAEPYNVAWCAVEYFESTGTILRMLLNHYSPNSLHLGRSLLHHAILCSNTPAVAALLSCGADVELVVKTGQKIEFRPVHMADMAARLGHAAILQCLIDKGCDLNSRTETGDTALMLCARYKREHCARVLVSGGADLSLVNDAGASAITVAASNRWSIGFQRAVLDAIRSGSVPKTSDRAVFSPIMFVARSGDVRALEALLMPADVDIDEQDENGFTALMFAAKEGHADAFRLLVFAGANVKLTNKSGETAIKLSQSNNNSELFEQVMLEFALEKGGAGGFYALHCAARRGDLAAVRLLTNRGHNVNLTDTDGYTPLMLAAREGHGKLCELLIASGAKCDIKTAGGETALSLARENSMFGNEAEEVILDEMARVLVMQGARVKKHTKRGKGVAHSKGLRMVGGAGVLRWGRSNRRNVVCREAHLGGSAAFQRNRRRKGDGFEPGLFRVVTTKGKEFHFVCDGGKEMAELWVRGIRMATRAVFG